MVDGIILIRARCEFQRAAERLADSNESLTRARKGQYIVDSPQQPFGWH